MFQDFISILCFNYCIFLYLYNILFFVKVAQKLLQNIENTEFKAALAPENIDKNRVKNVLPGK